MKNLKWRPLAAGLLVCSVLGTGSASAGETLSGHDIRKVFHGQFAGVVHGVVSVRFVARRNGRLTGYANGEKDRGRWSVRGRRLCIALSKWRNGRKYCSSVTRSGNWYRASSVKFRKL